MSKQSTLRFPLVISYIRMILPYLNFHTIHNMITYHMTSHVFFHMYSHQLVEVLGSFAAPADPPSTNFPLLFSTKTLQKWSPK